MPQNRGIRQPKSRASASKNSHNPWIPIGVLVLLIAGTSIAWWKASSSYVRMDALTLCATDNPPPAVVVVLVDTSDALTDHERMQLLNEFERVRDAIPKGGRIDLFSVPATWEGRVTPIISLCNPGSGEDMNSLYQNPAMARARWESSFKAEIDDRMRVVTVAESAPSSPILEAIRDVSVRVFGRPDLDESRKQLVIASDFLQHSPSGFSHYEVTGHSYQQLVELSRLPVSDANLSGVEITMLYLARPATKRLQNAAHIRFWMDYFSGSRAVLQRVSRIHGG